MKDTSVIPEGPYCYSLTKGDPCPYWHSDEDDDGEITVRCEYLGHGEWETGFLLWDMVKECGINEEEEDCLCRMECS